MSQIFQQMSYCIHWYVVPCTMKQSKSDICTLASFTAWNHVLNIALICIADLLLGWKIGQLANNYQIRIFLYLDHGKDSSLLNRILSKRSNVKKLHKGQFQNNSAPVVCCRLLLHSQAFIECLCISWIFLAFKMCGTWTDKFNLKLH